MWWYAGESSLSLSLFSFASLCEHSLRFYVPPSAREARTVIQRYQQIAKSQRQTASKCAKRDSLLARYAANWKARPARNRHARLSRLSHFFQSLNGIKKHTRDFKLHYCSITDGYIHKKYTRVVVGLIR